MTARDVTPVLRRVESGVRRGEVFPVNPHGARLLLRALLFDGAGVPAWHALAACAGMDESVFFTAPGTDPVTQVRRAKRVCQGCTVQTECLEDAMAWELPSTRVGVRGGLSAGERARLHTARQVLEVAA